MCERSVAIQLQIAILSILYCPRASDVSTRVDGRGMTRGFETCYRPGQGDDPLVVRTDDEVDHLVDALLAEPYENSVAVCHHLDRPLSATGKPDHEFLVAVDREAGIGALCHRDRGIHFSQGGRSGDDNAVYYYMGSDREFPRDSDIPIDLLREAVKEF